MVKRAAPTGRRAARIEQLVEDLEYLVGALRDTLTRRARPPQAVLQAMVDSASRAQLRVAEVRGALEACWGCADRPSAPRVPDSRRSNRR